MRIAAAHGVVLGLLVATWTLVMGVTGWYRDPVLQAAFFLVVPIEIVVVCLAIARTRAPSYGARVRDGAWVGLVASPIVLLQSLAFTTVLFPSYFDDLRASHRALLVSQGIAPEAIEAQVEAAAAGQTSLSSALTGAIATIVTGVIVASIAAMFLRPRTPPSN